MGSAEPARVAVSHACAADGPVFPAASVRPLFCDPFCARRSQCPLGTPSVVGVYLAHILAKKLLFQKVTYCFSCEWPDRDGRRPPKGRLIGLQGRVSALFSFGTSFPPRLAYLSGALVFRLLAGVNDTVDPELSTGEERKGLSTGASEKRRARLQAGKAHARCPPGRRASRVRQQRP